MAQNILYPVATLPSSGYAGANLTTGVGNSFFGYIAGYSTISGDGNTFVGNSAGVSSTESDNTCVGFATGSDFSTGHDNVFVGGYAGQSADNFNFCIGIGFESFVQSDLSNAVAIGAVSDVETSNTIALGGIGDWAVDVLIGYTSTSGYQLDVDGSTRCTSGSWVTSDQQFKQNIQNIDNALSLINKLHPVKYQFKENMYADADKKVKMNFPKGKQIGFIAQELEKVLPELVSTDNKGIKAVNYAQMVSILAQGIQEQDIEIKNLKASNEILSKQLTDIYQKLTQMDMNISQCCASNAAQNTAVVTINNTSKAILYQNTPNPFNEKTSIKYFLPENIQTATITIVSAQGIIMQKIALTQTGNGEITIPAGTLASGTYYYQMLIGEQLVDSKKMVVIK